MPYIVGIDIGGTFTDASAIDLTSGRELTAKTPTTPSDLAEGLFAAIDLLAAEAGVGSSEFLADTVKFAHGTTQTSNVVFTWQGAKTGLLTTSGFADEVLIMRARGRVAGLSLTERRHLRVTSKPPQIVPRALIEELAERVDAHGDVLVTLDPEEVRTSVRRLIRRGVESFAVALLWSIKNPDHERLVRRVILEEAPDAHVSLSHELAPVWGEYERTATAVVNAFVAPTLEAYLRDVVSELERRGLRVPVLVLQANGGVVQAGRVVPINTIESGPAAGMVAARALAVAAGFDRVIATDVGGTTFKVGLITDGTWSVSRNTVINQYEMVLPMVDLVSIGAGGGSIAWTDGRRLRIGPRSAGAVPGPACYGRGGTDPTVTDADLVLGFLDPGTPLAGSLPLRRDLAEEAIRPLADELFDGDVVAAAAGIRMVVDAQMGDLVRKATIERGHDPRRFVLLAYGGMGPLHAAGYARGLGVSRILAPASATVYSAFGAAASDIHHTLQRSVEARLIRDDAGLESVYSDLEAQAAELLDAQGIPRDLQEMSRWADMRYQRQLHDVTVTVPKSGQSISTALVGAFRQRYAELYGSAALLADFEPEVLRMGVEATGRITKPPLERHELTGGDVARATTGSRDVFWPEVAAWVSTTILSAPLLTAGDRLDGPAIIQCDGTAVAVPPGAGAVIDHYLNVVITLGEALR